MTERPRASTSSSFASASSMPAAFERAARAGPLSLPTLVSRAGAGQVLEVPLNVNELLGLQGSAKTLDETRDSLKL
jgi:hypothetical protein